MVSTSPCLSFDLSSLSSQQQSVIRSFEQGKNLFVTGGAGSGKSHLLNFLKRNYSKQGLEVTASTGVAAVNIGGATIHSFAGIGLANMPVNQIIENLFSKKLSRVRRKIKQVKALAIDEISMISVELLETLDEVFRAVRENNLPMGGMQVLLFGDFLQLPPVNKNSQNFNFCFNSEVWKRLNLEVFALAEIFRQNDPEFIEILNKLRFGEVDKNSRQLLESRLKASDENSIIKPTILTTHNAKVAKTNEVELKKIPREEKAYEAEYFGDNYKIEFLKKNCLAPELLRLKIGAQVMMIKNTYQKEGIINGSLGIIRDFSPKKSYPLVEFIGGKILTVGPEEWLIEKFNEEKKSMETEAGVSQIPLILAWAITIHKSQGLTLDKISCDLEDVFSPGQAYVALSRARSLKSIFIESINFSKITSDPEAVRFYRGLK